METLFVDFTGASERVTRRQTRQYRSQSVRYNNSDKWHQDMPEQRGDGAHSYDYACSQLVKLSTNPASEVRLAMAAGPLKPRHAFSRMRTDFGLR